MALECRCYPSSSSSYSSLTTIFPRCCPTYHSSLSLLFKDKRRPIRRRLSLSLSSSAPPNPNSSIPLSSLPIFLPFLQEQEQEEEEATEPDPQQSYEAEGEEEEENERKLNSITDPILRFFKSRSSTPYPDPTPEGKLTLQKNRRTSWHLAPTFNDIVSFPEPDPQPEPEPSVPTEILSPVGNEDLGPTNTGIVGEIMEIAKNSHGNFTLGEFLGPYEGKLTKRESVEVLNLMGREGLTISCLYFFEWMRLQDPSLVSARSCTVLFPLLGKSGMGGELLVLFRNLHCVKDLADVHVYNAAISGFLSCGRYDDALEVYKTMVRENVQPDQVTCSIMITIMRKKGNDVKDAWDFFEEMNRKGVKWSLHVMGALIKMFCEAGLKKEALIIQLEMEKKGVSSNAIIYNTLMDAYSKSNQIEEAEGIFAEMQSRGIAPTSASYNILMDAYSRRMQPEIVEKLMQEMEKIGLSPDVKSFTCLISAYGRQKKLSDRAADAFLRMNKIGIKPNSHSYTALIHAYSVSGWHEKASKTFENMQREGIKPSIETYTTLLDAFRRAGDTQNLMKIWKMMIKDKIEGTRVTFNILLDGFAKQGQYVEARDVIWEFGKIGLEPTVMTYNILMNAYARGGQECKLPQLLKDMAALNLKPDSVTYSTMIYAYIRVRDFKRAFFYHKQMVKSGQVPDPKSYQKLRAILEVKAATKNRKDKSAILGIINSQIGLLKVKKQGKKDEFWKNKKKRSRRAP